MQNSELTVTLLSTASERFTLQAPETPVNGDVSGRASFSIIPALSCDASQSRAVSDNPPEQPLLHDIIWGGGVTPRSRTKRQ